MTRGPYQWIGFYMIGTSDMKELTTPNSKFKESEVKNVKIIFLTVSQNSEESIYVGVCYWKSWLIADWKETPTHGFSCELWKDFKNTYFEELSSCK